MKFKAVKSRSLVIKKGQTTERFKLYVQNEETPSIVANLIQCLGKWFDASLHDRNNVRKLKRQEEDGLKKIDRCGLPGKFKAWLYQHALLPRLIWPLMLYEVPNTTERRSGAVVMVLDFGPRGPWFEPWPVHISLWP